MEGKALAKLPLFHGVLQGELAAIERRARLQRLRRGEALVRRGARLPGLCALASGTLKLAVSTPERGERVLGLVAASTSFGEALALRRQPSSFDIVALADAAVIVLPVSAVEALAEVAPRFARNLIAVLAERALALQGELEASLLQRAPQRLASYLCALAGKAEGECCIKLPVNKTLLAAMLGIKKETLSRLFRDLVERRLIALAGREITVLDPHQLCGGIL